MCYGGCCGAGISAGLVPLAAAARLEHCSHLSFLPNTGHTAHTKTSPIAKAASGKYRQWVCFTTALLVQPEPLVWAQPEAAAGGRLREAECLFLLYLRLPQHPFVILNFVYSN